MKAVVLFAAGFLMALPAHSDAPPGSPTGPATSANPSIVNPKSTGRRHICIPSDTSWVHSTAGSHTVLVHVTFQVAADGTVNDVVVDTSSGNASLDAYTVRCVSGWRYEPATKDGQPVAVPWSANVDYWHN
ncbi:MAG TPA: energy transducer TonB [Rhizomicrobium sp.]|nr:energy transducer TonB [Rhizomicrobium sp.]